MTVLQHVNTPLSQWMILHVLKVHLGNLNRHQGKPHLSGLAGGVLRGLGRGAGANQIYFLERSDMARTVVKQAKQPSYTVGAFDVGSSCSHVNPSGQNNTR